MPLLLLLVVVLLDDVLKKTRRPHHHALHLLEVVPRLLMIRLALDPNRDELSLPSVFFLLLAVLLVVVGHHHHLSKYLDLDQNRILLVRLSSTAA